MSRFDAIVVGGGHNGLVAAHYLARAGLSVAVLERRRTVGGPCGPVEYFPGYRAAMSNSPGSLEPKIVRDMRLEEFGLEFIRPNPTLVMPFPSGKAFVGWREKERVVECIRQFSERDVTRYYELFDMFNEFAKTLGISVFGPPPTLRELTANIRTEVDQIRF
jgi:phytoene dehydrogenase-like protein